MNTTIFKTLTSVVCFVFTVTAIVSVGYGQPQTHLGGLHTDPRGVFGLSSNYAPPMLKGIIVHPENPFQFDFILDSGDSQMKEIETKAESEKLIKYFLTALTLPEDDLWVNLSPYEADRIIPDEFGRTEMGQVLLEQDFLLKQLTASLMHPESELGEEFWDKVYARAYEKYGVTDIPVNTFNKVWIVPSKALVYENVDRAFVVESHLKVMLEEDYHAMKVENGEEKIEGKDSDIDSLSSNLIKEIILPAIEDEVNHGQHFAKLRQVYHSFILASWYKKNLKSSVLNQAYSDQKKIGGLETGDENTKDKVYNQYIEAFKTGVYDLIKEEYDATAQEIVPRKYFSGGVLVKDVNKEADFAMIQENESKKYIIDANFRLTENSVIDTETLTVQPSFSGGEQKRQEIIEYLFKEILRNTTKFSISPDSYEIYFNNSHNARVNFPTINNPHFLFPDSRPLDKRELLLHLPDTNFTGSVLYNDSVHSLFYFLKGNELEVISNSDDELMDDDYWEYWNEKDEYWKYITDIHPLLSQVIFSIVMNVSSYEDEIHILDIFGGNGTFLKNINKKLTYVRPSADIRYSFLEKNETSTRIANNNLEEFDNTFIYPATDISNIESFSEFLFEKPHIITALGGLNEGVISKKNAYKIAKNVYDVLPFGGFFVVSGYSNPLLYADNFSEIGFHVINASIPQKYFQKSLSSKLYILKKVKKDNSMITNQDWQKVEHIDRFIKSAI